jgi:hypothetical protein
MEYLDYKGSDPRPRATNPAAVVTNAVKRSLRVDGKLDMIDREAAVTSYLIDPPAGYNPDAGQMWKTVVRLRDPGFAALVRESLPGNTSIPADSNGWAVVTIQPALDPRTGRERVSA